MILSDMAQYVCRNFLRHLINILKLSVNKGDVAYEKLEIYMKGIEKMKNLIEITEPNDMKTFVESKK